MATTFNFELSHKSNAKGNYPIFIRITKNRKPKRVKTGIELRSKDHWNNKQQSIRKAEPNYSKWNKILEDELQKAKNIQRELRQQGKASLRNITNEIKQEDSSLSFLEFAEAETQKLYELGKYNTYKKNLTFLIKLKFFLNKKKPTDILKYKGNKLKEELSKMNEDLLFSEIDLDFLNLFHTYLRKQPNLRNPQLRLHPNTIHKQFAMFSSIYNRGIEEKRLWNTIKHNPFKSFKLKKAPTFKEKLTAEEVQKIIQLELEENSLIWHCRNYFLFAFYTAGMRASDLIHLRQKQIQQGRLYYEMDKTENRKSVKLYPQALEILAYYMDIKKTTEDYVFPLLNNFAPYAIAKTENQIKQLPPDLKKQLLQQVNSKNSLINNNLKKIAVKAKIDKKLTFHIARHSFANIARKKNANVYDISKMLGHSSIRITENYLANFDEESQDETMSQIYDTSPKEELTALLKHLSNEEAQRLIEQLKKQ